MTTTIRDTAGRIQEIVTRLSLPWEREHLFNPIHLKVTGGQVTTAAQSAAKDSVLQARPHFKSVDGDGEVTFSPTDVLKFLRLFKGDEEIVLEIGETVQIRGAARVATIHAEALMPRLPSKLPTIKDGIVHWKGGSLPSSIVVEGDAREFAKVLDDAKVLETKSYPLTLDEGTSYATLTGGTKNRVETQLAVTGKGQKTTANFGPSFAHVFSNLTGNVRVHALTDTGLGIEMNDDIGSYLFIVTAKLDVPKE